jgi:hypothetical protein
MPRAKAEELTLKLPCPVLLSVINEIGAVAEVFVVRKNQPLVGRLAFVSP